MELWIDGKKVAQNLENSVEYDPLFVPGKPPGWFVVVNTFDENTSKSVTFTVCF